MVHFRTWWQVEILRAGLDALNLAYLRSVIEMLISVIRIKILTLCLAVMVQKEVSVGWSRPAATVSCSPICLGNFFSWWEGGSWLLSLDKSSYSGRKFFIGSLLGNSLDLDVQEKPFCMQFFLCLLMVYNCLVHIN